MTSITSLIQRCVCLLTLSTSLCFLSGCDVNPACKPANLESLSTPPGYAVITTDYLSSAVALLDESGALLTEAWIDSGTIRPGLSTALSGDVVLPTAAVSENVLALIERLGVDTVTRIRVPEGTIISQTHVQLPTNQSQTGFRSNPQDVVAITPERAWVSRHERNPDNDAPPFETGNDVVVIDFSTNTLVTRMDFSALDIDTDGQHYLARPSRMVKTSSRVVIGLALLSSDFMYAGPGAVAVADPNTETFFRVALPGLRNCGEIAPVAGDTERVWVGCSGGTFSDQATRRATAGLVLLRIAAKGEATIEAVFRADDHKEIGVPQGGIVSIGGTEIVVPAPGETAAGTVDQLLRIDASSGNVDVLYEADASYVLGSGAYDPVQRLLLVPDAQKGLLRTHFAEDGTVEPVEILELSSCRNLPARQVRPL